MIGIFFISPLYLQAQCVVQPTTLLGSTSFDGDDFIGQTFTSCANGEIVRVRLTGGGFSCCLSQAGTYELYIAEEPGEGNSIPTNAVATLVFPVELTSGQQIEFDLSIPFPVKNDGTIYRFVVDNLDGDTNAMGATSSSLSNYPGGNFVSSTHSYNSNGDLDFTVTVQPYPPTVPTLSQWGLIVLCLFFMICGVLALIQKESVLKKEN
ncbi:MAG: hypothetical protein R3E32_12820 [Chitinophagales bacterium]